MKKLVVLVVSLTSLPSIAQAVPTNSPFFAMSKFPAGSPPAILSNNQLATIEAMAHVSANLGKVWVRAVTSPVKISSKTKVVRVKVPYTSTTAKPRVSTTTPKSTITKNRRSRTYIRVTSRGTSKSRVTNQRASTTTPKSTITKNRRSRTYTRVTSRGTSKSRATNQRASTTTPKSTTRRVSTTTPKSTNTNRQSRSYTSVTRSGPNNYVWVNQTRSSNNGNNVANISQRSPY